MPIFSVVLWRYSISDIYIRVYLELNNFNYFPKYSQQILYKFISSIDLQLKHLICEKLLYIFPVSLLLVIPYKCHDDYRFIASLFYKYIISVEH